MQDQDQELIVTRRGRIGHLLLNRPKALNALTLDMVRRMDHALMEWSQDDAIEAVVVTGEGDRAFCAGGDVKSVYFAGKAGEVGRDGTLTADFFREEYQLNHRVANYPKPYVSYIDGVTMGGGVGISILGSHRIASEQTKFAMPETAIGFFPDVGGSFFMSRPGPVGILLSLTGKPIDYSATLDLGFATHFIPRDSATQLVDQLANDGLDATLQSLSQPHPKSELVSSLISLADRCFTAATLEAIFASLEETSHDSDAATAELAGETLATLRRKSPTSMKVTLEQLRRGAEMPLEECLVMEYRISQACMQGHDFYEGIRAVLVDKDHSPNWSPESIEQVDAELVQRHFEALGERDLRLG